MIAFSRYVPLVCLFVAGCASAEAQEDRAILDAIDVLRESSPDDSAKRRELIDALAKRPATSPLGKEARDSCVEAYRFMLQGKEGTEKVKKALEKPSEATFNLAETLEAADESIKKSEPAMRACQKASIDLSMKRR